MKHAKALLLPLGIACLFAVSVGQTASSGKAKNVTKQPSTPSIAAQIERMKELLDAQQIQLQQLKQDVQSRDQQIQQLQNRLDSSQTAATQAQTKADNAVAQAAQQQQAVTDLKSDLTDLKAGMTRTVTTLQETQKAVLESPAALHFKGITITPGGFLAAEFVRRSRALGADINTPFNSLTMPGASGSTMSEFFGSGRQSRVSMLAEGRLKSSKLSGYVEADFLSAGVTSNNNQSNAYTLRQRQAWGQAAFDDGWSFTGGQTWSLVTETKHGVDNRSEVLPMTIDAQYHVGFSWARQYGLRLAKAFNNKAWLAVSLENAQATLTSHNNGTNFLVGQLGASGGLYNAFNGNYSFNPSPDIVAKLVLEPGVGHYEIFGVYSRFRDRVFPCGEVASSATCRGHSAGVTSAAGAYNSSRNGGGIGANARWSFDNKHVDFGLHAFGGSGVGRYGSGGLPDVSVRANGTLELIRSYQGLTTLEWHGPKLDVYLNTGAEYASRAADYDVVSRKYVGYGSPFFSNTGCYTETVPGSGGFSPGSQGSSCTADTRVLIEGTAGFWYRFYNGPKGRVQWGPQFSYVTRNTWSGASVPNEPHGVDGMVFTSFRYYLP